NALTMKKYDGQTKPVPQKGNPDTFDPADNKCLLRTTDGKTICTVMSSKEMIKFQMVYSNLLRAHMDGLKKKGKKGESEKSKGMQWLHCWHSDGGCSVPSVATFLRDPGALYNPGCYNKLRCALMFTNVTKPFAEWIAEGNTP
ncbi:hypothetical protein scyTo_0019314, partial [Scyliorhinus torazame]|nr:hypothetical protein [Scyliorhinus torazame]